MEREEIKGETVNWERKSRTGHWKGQGNTWMVVDTPLHVRNTYLEREG